MRKSLFAITFIFLGFISIAQPFRWNDVSIIMQGSAYNSMLRNPQHFNEVIDVNQITPRFSGGLGLMYSFSDDWGISTGVDYQRRGARFSQFLRGNDVTRDYKIDYLDINLMLRRFTTKGFMIGVGGYAGILVREELRFKHDVVWGSTTVMNGNRYNDLDYGVQLELGYLLDLDYRTKATVSLFAQYGLTDVNAPRFQVNNFDDVYNPAQNFIAGIRFTVYVITQPY
ncbi:hypothetical protein B9T16_29340 [Arthrospira sp. PCC 8006]|jgi:hypothetical protein|uniref:porin family protein n=1 Tax=Arthrospira sp. PCC 8006 TaxID=1982224 RepID=UPI00396E43C3